MEKLQSFVNIRLALSPGRWAILEAPSQMTPKEWRRLRASLKAAKVGFVAPEPVDRLSAPTPVETDTMNPRTA